MSGIYKRVLGMFILGTLFALSQNTAYAQADKAVVAEKDGDVGNKKTMNTDVTLYRNGRMVISTYSRSRHLTEGLRGRLYVVCVDGKGNAIWATEPDKCTTRGSKGDLFTESAGSNTFDHDIPAAVAKATDKIDIYHSTDDLDGAYQKMVENIIKTVKDSKDIVVEVRDAVLEVLSKKKK